MRALSGKLFSIFIPAFICCLLWGSAFPCIKIGYTLFEIGSADAASQILFAGIRFALAGVFTILFGSIINRRFLIPKRSSLGNIFRLSCFQTIGQYVFFYLGLARTSGINASIIDGSASAMAILAASLIFRTERLNTKKTVAMAAGFAGVVIISASSGAEAYGAHLSGDIMILLSTVCYAFSTVYLKKFSETENVAVLSGYQFLAGGIIMAAAGLCGGGRLTAAPAAGIALVAYLAFVSAAAYTIWGILLSKNPVSSVAVCGFMTPVLGAALSALILRESVAAGAAVLSLALICASIILINKNDMTGRVEL